MEEKGVKMIAAASDALTFRRNNPGVGHDRILKHIFSVTYKEKDKEAKIGMIAAASRAVDIVEKNPLLRDREVLRIVMEELPNITQVLSSSENLPLEDVE